MERIKRKIMEKEKHPGINRSELAPKIKPAHFKDINWFKNKQNKLFKKSKLWIKRTRT